VEIYLKFKNSSAFLVGCLDGPVGIPTITLGDNEDTSNISEFLQIIGAPKDITPLPEGYDSMCKTLAIQGIHQVLAIPRHRMEDHVQILLERLRNVFSNHYSLAYLETYMTVRELLCKLSRASVDREKLDKMMISTSNASIKGNLQSLVPETDHLLRRVSYSMSSTNTGRLIVKSGPKILTAPSVVRSCLKSRFPNGKILQIDVISAEPKFALYDSGVDPPIDVYAYISSHILEGKVTRNSAKLITLCALYGQSLKKLSEKLPKEVSARAVVRKTKEFFQYDRLLTKLRSDYSSGNFRNAFGRPLHVDSESPHLLISHYLQSSVAEGSILMFSNFLKKAPSTCIPLFVIHDALVVDVDEDLANNLLEDQHSFYLKDWRFEVTVTKLSDS
tara:strand:+ start:326 stop:1492 length:1167 start_codon:yes stop_codon:yes gene_type:complete